MIQQEHALSQQRQCELLNINRSTYYYTPMQKNEEEVRRHVMKVYQTYPVYGYRRITACLRRDGMLINHKKVQRLMQETGLQAIYPGVVTTRHHKGNKIYPNLLKDLSIDRAHQAYQTDITYIRTIYGFMYLIALIDAYSRHIVSWRLSNSLSVGSCLDALSDALSFYPWPFLVHSDQGAQFTSQQWVAMLTTRNIAISMSGQGNSNQNAQIERLWRTLKYEYFYMFTFKTPVDLKKIISQFVQWYNHDRPHQALGYKTPAEVLNPHTSHTTHQPFTKKEDFVILDS